MSQVYGPLELPSGKKIKFRRAVGLDRSNVTQMVAIDQNNIVTGSLTIENYIQAKVITEIDGVPQDGTKFKTLFNDWDDGDVQYYQAVYTEMFGMTQEKMDDAKAKAAFLLANSTSTDGSSSQSPVTAPSTSGSPTVTG